MTPISHAQLDDLLSKIAEALDIPDFVYEGITLKYDDIASWLAGEDSDLTALTPDIYTQGSFRIGTVNRSVGDKGEVDIDLVCQLEISKEQTSQAELKRRVGARISKRPDLAKRLEERRRCWTLHFSDEKDLPPFHLDVLPAIPNPAAQPTGVLIADRELVRWQETNPIAYSEWFFARMKDAFAQRQNAIAKSLELNIEDVPQWRVKTSLQVAVQILKRHRDVFFRSRSSARPSSILITTLAALNYSSLPGIVDTITRLSSLMPSPLEKRDGKWWLPNPVDAKENFADKWNEDANLPNAFNEWVARLRRDTKELGTQSSLERVIALLASIVGQAPTYAAAGQLGLHVPSPIAGVFLPEPAVPSLASTAHAQQPRWPMKPTYKCRIRGAVHFSKTTKRRWDLTGSSVPKNVWLRFSISTDAPSPYTVKWQVVNTGREALQANGLRGDFYDSEPVASSKRWESTSYLGTHWIEAFVIKDDVCVARSGKKYVRIR